MVRKTIRALVGICGGVSLAGVLAFTGDAQANTNQHATTLRSDSAATQGCFNYDYVGFYRNSTTGACSGNLTAVAPIIFSPPATAGSKTVYVDGTCANGGISAAVWTIDYNGTLLGWHSANLSGNFDTPLTFTTAETGHWAYMHVYTQWGAAVSGSNCRLYGFDVTP